LRKYPLSINIIGEGEVIEEIVNTGRTTDYNSGSSIKLTANPSNGWIFDKWTGAIETIENPVSLIIDSNKEVTAHFIIDPNMSSNALEVKSYNFEAVDNYIGVFAPGFTPGSTIASQKNNWINNKTVDEIYS
jgi:hypothetical protein